MVPSSMVSNTFTTLLSVHARGSRLEFSTSDAGRTASDTR